MKEYKYVGPHELLGLISCASTRQYIQSKRDILSWIKRTHQKTNAAGEVVATFIMDTNGCLWVADRHSEHVACAAGGPVLSAGEMGFRVTKEEIEVSNVTNQSTGFCPDAASWPRVAEALRGVGLSHPDEFTVSFTFRRCDGCGSINLVKDDWFVCGVCDAELNQAANLNTD